MCADPVKDNRKHYIDWLRVIAIGILLVFHIMVMYQPYANDVRFIESPTLLGSLMIPLSLFSVMRIPLLFFVSGMGVFFSLQGRDWKQLLVERTKRILVPLLFGSAAIVPIHAYIFAKYYAVEYTYVPDVAHLWFLINICMYVLWFLALFYFVKEFTDSRFLGFLGRLVERQPFAVYLLVLPYVLEALTIPSDVPYALFFDSRVGLLLGGVAFLLGFTFVALGEVVWQAVSKIKYYSLGLAMALLLIRWTAFETRPPHVLTSLESVSWILAAFGLGYAFLNRPGKVLRYLSSAAYPFYIIHMVFLYLGAYLIFPLDVNPWLSFVAIVVFTFAGCFVTYELIRRVFFLRPLFGMKVRRR